jgi:hypothetical protein
MTGYPKTLFMDSLSLLGKILRIADVYEALTSQRAYRSRSYAPDEALRKMWREAGKNFDSVLLKRFISMMGIYPIGSVVELSDQSVALVMDYPGDSESGMPLVLRLVDDGSGALKRGDMVFLPRQNHKADPERLTIVRGLLPAGLGVNPAEYFLHVK